MNKTSKRNEGPIEREDHELESKTDELHLRDLPDDLVVYIFRYLYLTDLFAALRVQKVGGFFPRLLFGVIDTYAETVFLSDINCSSVMKHCSKLKEISDRRYYGNMDLSMNEILAILQNNSKTLTSLTYFRFTENIRIQFPKLTKLYFSPNNRREFHPTDYPMLDSLWIGTHQGGSYRDFIILAKNVVPKISTLTSLELDICTQCVDVLKYVGHIRILKLEFGQCTIPPFKYSFPCLKEFRVHFEYRSAVKNLNLFTSALKNLTTMHLHTYQGTHTTEFFNMLKASSETLVECLLGDSGEITGLKNSGVVMNALKNLRVLWTVGEAHSCAEVYPNLEELHFSVLSRIDGQFLRTLHDNGINLKSLELRNNDGGGVDLMTTILEDNLFPQLQHVHMRNPYSPELKELVMRFRSERKGCFVEVLESVFYRCS